MLVFDCPHAPPHGFPMDLGDLVTKILQRTGDSQTDLGERLGVSQPTVSRWKKGDMRAQDEHKDAIIAEAQRLGILVGEVGNSKVTIVGIVGSGQLIELITHKERDISQDMAAKSNPKTVAVSIKGEAMLPVAENGWLIYYDDTMEPPAENLLRKLCVVQLDDGRMFVRRLFKGSQPDTWNLLAANGSLIEDVRVQWAAKVKFIEPD